MFLLLKCHIVTIATHIFSNCTVVKLIEGQWRIETPEQIVSIALIPEIMKSLIDYSPSCHSCTSSRSCMTIA